jgi:hypothetical protein
MDPAFEILFPLEHRTMYKVANPNNSEHNTPLSETFRINEHVWCNYARYNSMFIWNVTRTIYTCYRFLLGLLITSKQSQNQSQNYITTDGQSAKFVFSSSPIWGPSPGFCYCQIFAGFLIWGAISDERKVCRLLAFASLVILWSESSRTLVFRIVARTPVAKW